MKDKYELQYVNPYGDTITRDYFDSLSQLAEFSNQLIRSYEVYGTEVAGLNIVDKKGNITELWTNDDLIKGVDYEL